MSRRTDRIAAVHFDLAACGEPDSTDFDTPTDDEPLGVEEFWGDEVCAFYRAYIVAGTTLTGEPLPDDLWIVLLTEIDSMQSLTAEEYDQVKRVCHQRNTTLHRRIRDSSNLELESATIADGEAQEQKFETSLYAM